MSQIRNLSIDTVISGLADILIASYDHNTRIKQMEKAACGLIRCGGDDRFLSLDAIRFHAQDLALDCLGVPPLDKYREKCREKLEQAGGTSLESRDRGICREKIKKALYWALENIPNSFN